MVGGRGGHGAPIAARLDCEELQALAAELQYTIGVTL